MLTEEWLTGRQARMLLGCTHYTLMLRAMLGEIQYRADRGLSVRYLKADVERLKEDRKPVVASA